MFHGGLAWHQEKPKGTPYDDETTSGYEEILTHGFPSPDKPEARNWHSFSAGKTRMSYLTH
jgi:hypothetical protein